jgi:membrane protein YdbS with pleckstrin-like domain
MPTYQCDRCDNEFAAEPVIGPDGSARATCPACGDVRRIDGDSAKSARSRGAVADERTLLIARPALFRAHPLTYGGLLGLAFAGAVIAVLPLFTVWAAWVSILGGVLLLVAAGIFLQRFVFGHRWYRLKVTDRRTIDERGLITRRHSEVLHEHAVNVRINQGAWQRLMGLGDIEIESAAGGSVDISIGSIPDPYGVKKLIDQHRGR